MALPGVKGAASAVRRSETGISILVGYVVKDGSINASDREMLRQLLPAALVPMLVVIKDLPVRTSGKVDRAVLPWPPPMENKQLLDETISWLAEQWRRVSGTALWFRADHFSRNLFILAGTSQTRKSPLHSCNILEETTTNSPFQVLGVPARLESNFFDQGGTSLAAAQLASLIRERYSTLSVVDIYQNPTLACMSARLEKLAGTNSSLRIVLPTPRSSGYIQMVVLLGLLTFEGLRWEINVALFTKLASLFCGTVPWAEELELSWVLLLTAWLTFISLPGRILVTAGAVRLLTAGITPGKYPRGGWTHIRLWAAERLVPLSGILNIVGTHWNRRFARLLGCRVGTGTFYSICFATI